MVEEINPPRGPSERWAKMPCVALAHRLLGERIARRSVFAHRDGLFQDPSWDILLDLYVANSQSRTVSVSSSCVASGVPATTGLRHIDKLERQGLVARRPDPTDNRRSFLELTATAFFEMTHYLQSIDRG